MTLRIKDALTAVTLLDEKLLDVWASLNNSVFICIYCSGFHRGYGTHISFIRSVALDTWSDDQIKKMNVGGNARLHAYFEKYNLNNFEQSAKYKSKAADIYRKNLDREMAGEPLEPEPSYEEGRKPMAQSKRAEGQMFAFGSDDLEPHTSEKSGAIDSTISAGKETLSKIGNFIDRSFKDLTKKKQDDSRGTGNDESATSNHNDESYGAKITGGVKFFGVD